MSRRGQLPLPYLQNLGVFPLSEGDKAQPSQTEAFRNCHHTQQVLLQTLPEGSKKSLTMQQTSNYCLRQ